MADDSDIAANTQLPKIPERYHQADVSFWAIVALVCAGFAVIIGNISGAMPSGLIAGLHTSRLEGGNFNSLRTSVASLERQLVDLKQESNRLNAMLTLADQGRGDITRRVGALEASIPDMLEVLPANAGIDLSTTASIDNGDVHTKDAYGGHVSYSMEPLFIQPDENVTIPVPVQVEQQQMKSAKAAMPPELPRVATEDYGIALGPGVTLKDAFLTWSDLRQKVGALLLGLEPVLATGQDGQYRLVAGPISNVTESETLCGHISRVGVSCLTVPYAGYAMPQ